MQGPVSFELMTSNVASNQFIIVGWFEQLLISAQPDSLENVVGKSSLHSPAQVSIVFYQIAVIF